MEQSKRSAKQRILDMQEIINDLKIEGLTLTEEQLNILRQVALGNRSTDEVIRETLDNIAKLKVTNPEKFYKEGETK